MKKTGALRSWISSLELRAIGWMDCHGLFALRIAMAVVFIWFGALKPLGLSPATQLVLDVTWWIPVPDFVTVLGIWEVAIGVCFLFERTLRAALVLLFLHMPGTALPLVLVPEQAWVDFPWAFTLEGQYIVKNLVLVSAALVIGGTIQRRMGGFARFAPAEFQNLLHHGHWGTAETGDLLTEDGQPNERVYFVQSGHAEVIQNGECIAIVGADQFIGEMSFLTGDPACATVRATENMRYIYWPWEELRQLIDDQPGLCEALHATLNLDLLGKLRADRDDRGPTPA